MLNNTIELIPNSSQHVATSRLAPSLSSAFPMLRDRRSEWAAGTSAYGGRTGAGFAMAGSAAMVGVTGASVMGDAKTGGLVSVGSPVDAAGFGDVGVLPRGGAVS